MPGRTPAEALLNSIEPLQTALNYITVGRLTFGNASREFEPGTIQSVALNGGKPTPVRSTLVPSLSFSSIIWLRLHLDRGHREPYSCEIASYWHTFEIEQIGEFLAYHWTPLATGEARTSPHMHVGSLVTGSSSILPARFHKLHLATGIVTIEDVVRFAIEELNAELRPSLDRSVVLKSLARASRNIP